MKAFKETASEIGLVFAGGTIFADINPEGYKDASSPVDLADIVQSRDPDLGIKISRPSLIAYTGLSENINAAAFKSICQATIETLLRDQVRSVVITHGSDLIEVTGDVLNENQEINGLLREKKASVYLVYSNEPYPHREAQINLKTTLLETMRRRKPGVYISSEFGVIPADRARKETYCGRPMRFYDYKDPRQKAEEECRRLKVFRTANELSQALGYPGMFVQIAKSIPKFNKEKIIYGVAVRPTSHKHFVPLPAPARLSKREVLLTMLQNHALQRELITPFPGYQAFFWPVNRLEDPLRLELTIQGFFPDTRACILILNHSGTAHTKDPRFSIARAAERMRIERNIVTFAVTETGEPTRFGEGSYVTSRDLKEAGVVPLPMHSKVAWVKTWAAMDQGLRGVELIDFMTKKICPDEFTGELDDESVQFARVLTRATPIRELRLPGKCTGYLLIPKE